MDCSLPDLSYGFGPKARLYAQANIGIEAVSFEREMLWTIYFDSVSHNVRMNDSDFWLKMLARQAMFRSGDRMIVDLIRDGDGEWWIMKVHNHLIKVP